MRFIRAFGAFVVVFLLYHVLFGSSVFPVDENNILQAPVWYPVAGILLSGLIAYFAYRGSPIGRRRSHNTSERVITSKFIEETTSACGISSDAQKAMRIVFETGQASVSMIQRKSGWKYERAVCAMNELERAGIVGASDGVNPRKILVSLQHDSKETLTNTPSVLGVCSISDIDGMDGHAFEYWCAELLKKSGFASVKVTQGSGDQGVDILAVKDGIKYAIQCKCYSSDLGNKPIQEVNTGKTIYRCQIGVVMTNRYFTAGGKEAAKATGVLLWDRDKLQEMLKRSLETRP